MESSSPRNRDTPNPVADEMPAYDYNSARAVVSTVCEDCGARVWFVALRGESLDRFYVLDLLGDIHDCLSPGFAERVRAGALSLVPATDGTGGG